MTGLAGVLFLYLEQCPPGYESREAIAARAAGQEGDGDGRQNARHLRQPTRRGRGLRRLALRSRSRRLARHRTAGDPQGFAGPLFLFLGSFLFRVHDSLHRKQVAHRAHIKLRAAVAFFLYIPIRS